MSNNKTTQICSFSIDPELLKELDRLVEYSDTLRNRSHAISMAIQKFIRSYGAIPSGTTKTKGY